MESYKKVTRHKKVFIIMLFIALIGLFLLNISVGSIKYNPFEVISTVFGDGSKQSEIVIFDIRLPRALATIFVGAALAMAGTIMQNILRNPLASASTLGVSQGAAFGAATGIILFGAGTQNSVSASAAIDINNPYIVTICAFIGGFISTGIVLLLSRIRSLTASSLVLVGIALSSLFGGGLTLLQYFASDVQISAIVFWTFGDVGRAGKTEVLMIAIFTLAAFVYFLFNKWNYNALSGGVNTAKSLGVNVNRTILLGMAVCSLISAIAVAFVGIISFVGLVSPHLVRRFVGNDYKYLIIASGLCGSIMLLVADFIGRMVISPVVLPIGAITSFAGAPVFLYLIYKGGKHGKSY